MFRVIVHGYILSCLSGGLPQSYEIDRERAKLVDEIDLDTVSKRPYDEDICFLAVQKIDDTQPLLIVAQKYAPSRPTICYPQTLIIPETYVLFLGAGERVVTYRLDPPEKVEQDTADTGFHTFDRHGQYVVMNAELEVAVWNIHGHKQWSQFVEPPWTYSIEGDTMHLDVMDHVLSFPLSTGPGQIKKLWW